MPKKLFLHAPGIHVGGGLTLLQALYSAADSSVDFEQLDARVANLIPPSSAERHLIWPSLFSRLGAEFRLQRRVAKGDVVLCFSGLVPLLRCQGEITVFLQNRLLVSGACLHNYSLRARLRLTVERFLIKNLAHRVNKFIVQSPSMAEQTQAHLGPKANVVICPFIANSSRSAVVTDRDRRFDFVYVASAEPHKNHQALLRGWSQLAEQGIRPSLALTLPLDSPLAGQVADLKERLGLNISNLGPLTPTEVGSLYAQSRALIYPSFIESLGLPLIEAFRAGLPIIAAELDYVRDIVEPAETFDPHSATSIARAVKRHIGIVGSPQAIFGPEVFLREVLR
ncbi:glycosyltransferase [Pseudomonas fluorescens]